MTIFLTILIILVLINLAISFALILRSGQAKLVEMRLQSMGDGFEKVERSFREELAKNREEMARSLKDFSGSSTNQIMGLTRINEDKLENLRKAVEDRLKTLQDDNSKKLEQIRQTVDEKLHETLEKRLGESFKLVSDRLELVHKGLGEMQTLASGVGDLKKVLMNVKTKGVLGELQLENILEQILTPDQYLKNVATKKDSRENVEFAIKLPGKTEEPVLLPIDSKFPTEDYQRLLDAQENGDKEAFGEASKALEDRIKSMAQDIRDKYINPPTTTDFAILFLPFEGLYAEVLRHPKLFEQLQREYKVTITGPTTTAAFLNSLQMGFRTLAIGKRSSEVWNLLEAIKKEFGNFGNLLDRANKQLQTVSKTMEDVGSKSRTIERKLKNVHALPEGEELPLIEMGEEEEISEPEV